LPNTCYVRLWVFKTKRKMKETFESYMQRLKDRRTEDDYKYTDEDFEQYKQYIRDCWLTNLSVYKCLEFMYFETQS
jgi:hypothetical protein